MAKETRYSRIRERRRQKHIKRNGIVFYNGTTMRIAHTDGDGLKLRKEFWVYPLDDYMFYERTKALVEAVNGIQIDPTLSPEAQKIARRLIKKLHDGINALPESEA